MTEAHRHPPLPGPPQALPAPSFPRVPDTRTLTPALPTSDQLDWLENQVRGGKDSSTSIALMGAYLLAFGLLAASLFIGYRWL